MDNKMGKWGVSWTTGEGGGLALIASNLLVQKKKKKTLTEATQVLAIASTYHMIELLHVVPNIVCLESPNLLHQMNS